MVNIQYRLSFVKFKNLFCYTLLPDQPPTLSNFSINLDKFSFALSFVNSILYYNHNLKIQKCQATIWGHSFTLSTTVHLSGNQRVSHPKSLVNFIHTTCSQIRIFEMLGIGNGSFIIHNIVIIFRVRP